MTNDPTQLAILARAFRAITEEMGVNLTRSAFSTVVREAADCSSALLTATGSVLAQSEMNPTQTAALSRSFDYAAQQLDLSNARSDDIIIMNDPYCGGQHLNDIIMFQPIIIEERLVGWASSTAHHLDIGGATAGVNTEATELLQEGLVIPPILINLERDWRGGAVERLIFANIRTAEIGLGDANAQLAAIHIGIERVKELVNRHGADFITRAMEETLDYSERRMRAAIEQLPDGSFNGEAYVDRDVFDDAPVRVAVTVTVKGSDMTLDFTGTSPQVKGMINSPVSSSMAGALTAVRNILSDRDIPANDGCNRPLTMIFPEGSVLNPHPGAPVRARMGPVYRIIDSVHAALADAVPDKVPAQGFNTLTGFYLSQVRPEGSRIYVDVFGGGYGGAKDYDGAHALDNAMSSCRCVPVESIEQTSPHLLVRGFELVQDSCGAGEFRGGLGFVRKVEILEDGVVANLYSDHYRLAPQGRGGGTEGGRGGLRVHRDDTTIELGSTSTYQLKAGDVIELRMGGGAGWGDPARRDPKRVERDVAEGVISIEYAQRHYGWSGRCGDPVT